MNIQTISIFIPVIFLFLFICSCSNETEQKDSVIIKSEFIYEQAPFPSAHASTIVESGNSILAAWFGGTAERNPDVGIWLARFNGKHWSKPVEIDNGMHADGKLYPCWNPVLFQLSKGPLLLFYKVGPNPREWWGVVRTSDDNGQTWSSAINLPDGILGPIRAKPVELPDGTLLAGSSTEHAGWIVHMVMIQNPTLENLASSAAWQKTGPLNDPKEFGAIQPTILVHSPKDIQILNRSKQAIITESWSEDAGKNWNKMTATSLPNPNAGIDVVKLKDGRFLLIYNPIAQGRHKLSLSISEDGKEWHDLLNLEDSPGEYSYPAMIQSNDGLVHITYTWKRERIKHPVIDASKFD
jgi:predicted neuraminidase